MNTSNQLELFENEINSSTSLQKLEIEYVKKEIIDNRDLVKKNSPFNLIEKYTFLIKRKIKLI